MARKNLLSCFGGAKTGDEVESPLKLLNTSWQSWVLSKPWPFSVELNTDLLWQISSWQSDDKKCTCQESSLGHARLQGSFHCVGLLLVLFSTISRSYVSQIIGTSGKEASSLKWAWGWLISSAETRVSGDPALCKKYLAALFPLASQLYLELYRSQRASF